MNFGQAIEAVKTGKSVARAGWNGKNMHVYLNRGSRPPKEVADFNGGVSGHLFDMGHKGTSVRMPNLNLRAADGSIVTGWLASQTDILAEDWEIVQ